MRLALSLGVFAVLAIPGTTAAWTDPVAVSGTTLKAGTADLKVNNGDAPTFTAMNASTMEGGDSTAGVLTVRNNGDVPLSYYVSTSATNADGKNLASQFSVKVTGDGATSGSSPNVACSGSALGSSGTSFGGNLLGSSSNLRSLDAGASETICVQASLANGTAALGSTTNITFTFTAITGTSAVPGWTDAVQTSGTTLAMINAFYLGTNAAGSTTSSDPLPLRRTGPTLTTLFNYDTDRDTTAGLLVKLTGAPSGRQQQWSMGVGASPLTLSGTASVRLWSAMRNFDPTLVGSLAVTLLDCDVNTANCSQVATATITSAAAWSGGSGTWVRKSWNLGATNYTFAAGRTIAIRVAPTATSGDDMMLAYDTTTYKTALIIQ